MSLRIHEHREAATRAGLLYVTDGVAGIRRQRKGLGWAFYSPSGRPIKGEGGRRRIPSLVIPPAWTDVWICPPPPGHIPATPPDARGRNQYRDHSRYPQARHQSKV